MSKAFLIVSAVLESATGLALLASPAVVVSLLVGAPLEGHGGLVAARVAGTALLSLGIACWIARATPSSFVARALLTALLVYNAGTAAILVHAALGLGRSGVGTWPTVLLHTTLALWCAACLRDGRGLSPP